MSSGLSNQRQFQPMRFGRYTLLNPLSTGAMGELFLARLAGAPGFERLCVIKRMLPQFADDADFVARFNTEAKTLLKLSHGNIAQVLDVGVHDGAPFIALEFVDGKDLGRVASRMRERNLPVPLSFTLAVACKVLEALSHAHRKRGDDGKELNLVHRDVSAQNVLISYEGEVKVVDFGLAKSALSTAKTSPGTALQGLRSMSPEQARHQPVDRRADVYAMGLMLFELVTGKHPFAGLSDAELMMRVGAPKHVPASQLEPLCPAALSSAIAKALAVDPAERFQTAEEFRSVLSAILQDIDSNAGAELLSRVLHDAFNEEYSNERKLLASLKNVQVPEEETPEPAAEDELPMVPGVLHVSGEHKALVPPKPAAPVTAEAPLPSIVIDGMESEELPASAPMRKTNRAKQEAAAKHEAGAKIKVKQVAKPSKATLPVAAPEKKPVMSKNKAAERKRPPPENEEPVQQKAGRPADPEETRSQSTDDKAKKSPLGWIVGIVVTLLLIAAAIFGWNVYSEQFDTSKPLEAEAINAVPNTAPKSGPKQKSVEPVVIETPKPVEADDDLVALKADPKRKATAPVAAKAPTAAQTEEARAFKALEADYRKLEGKNESVVKKFRIKFNVLKDAPEGSADYLSRVNSLHDAIRVELSKPENQ